ncbi:MAG: hypothetical protein GXY34_15400 [Syntrophomonadaceae bacterium]|nr:hypothetical protein [Syntrophomonadaceae bacterium]
MNWINHFGPTSLIIIGAILSLIGAIWSQEQSNKQTDNILKLNKQITDAVIGGDSYPLAMPVWEAKYGEEGEIKKICLLHEGKDPIYDLVVIITDLIAFKNEQAKDISIQNQDAYMWKKQIGTFGRGYEEILLEIPSTYTSHIDYIFNFIARNGQITQRSIYFKRGKKWITATRLEKNGKIFREIIRDKDFPMSLFKQPI